MRSHRFNYFNHFGAAAFFLLAIPSWAAGSAILGGDPRDAIRLFREADADCRRIDCRQRGRYAFGTSKGRTHVLYYTWDQARPLTLNDARKLAGKIIPDDAQTIRTTTKADGSVVEIFTSDALARTFGLQPDVWIGASPGTFVVFHSIRRRKTIISVGDHQ